MIKTHTALDGLPWDDRVTYVCVGRDPRDVALSWDNHRGTSGQWREILDDADRQRYAARAEALADPDLLAWAHGTTDWR